MDFFQTRIRFAALLLGRVEYEVPGTNYSLSTTNEINAIYPPKNFTDKIQCLRSFSSSVMDFCKAKNVLDDSLTSFLKTGWYNVVSQVT